MKQTASGWVILTRNLVGGFHPQNDRLRKAAAPPADPTAFVQVPNLLAQAPAAAVYRLHLAGGMILEIGSGFESEELSALLQLLRA